MAERVIRQIIDDIDKSEIAEGEGERIKFTFRGVAYQLDLSNANVAKLEKALAPYIDAAASASSGIEGSTSAADERPSPRRRRVAKKTAKRNRRPIARSGKEQLAAIRAWASENGYSVSARGRIPAGVVEAYRRHIRDKPSELWPTRARFWAHEGDRALSPPSPNAWHSSPAR